MNGEAGPADESTGPGAAALLHQAVDLLMASDRSQPHPGEALRTLPALGQIGIGAESALSQSAAAVVSDAAQLNHPGYFAHMDPPTPAIAQGGALWAAALNQNLLHTDTGPMARAIEREVVQWFAPLMGMTGGHMTAGSSLANLTALWAARETTGIRRVVASEAAHLSVRKAASILGLEFEVLPTVDQRLVDVPDDLHDAALVLTAGTTAVGAVDDLDLGDPRWLHIDAAWAGPLRLSPTYRGRLHGLERADSLVVSAHKWLYQPKESALALFRDPDAAHESISFGGGYLAVPNVGLQGSHGLTALPLYLTALAWGVDGFASRIEADMQRADDLAAQVEADARFELWGPNSTGVIAWRPRLGDADQIRAALEGAFVSGVTIDGERWWRSVAANPNADIAVVLEAARSALNR